MFCSSGLDFLVNAAAASSAASNGASLESLKMVAPAPAEESPLPAEEAHLVQSALLHANAASALLRASHDQMGDDHHQRQTSFGRAALELRPPKRQRWNKPPSEQEKIRCECGRMFGNAGSHALHTKYHCAYQPRNEDGDRLLPPSHGADGLTHAGKGRATSSRRKGSSLSVGRVAVRREEECYGSDPEGTASQDDYDEDDEDFDLSRTPSCEGREGEPMVPNALPLPPQRNIFDAASAVARHLWHAKPLPVPRPPPPSLIAATFDAEGGGGGVRPSSARRAAAAVAAAAAAAAAAEQHGSGMGASQSSSPSPFTVSIKRKLACA